MPIYEFICARCGLKFDYLLRSSAEKIFCPKCKARKLKRLISSFAFSAKDAQGNITSSSRCRGCASGNCSTCS